MEEIILLIKKLSNNYTQIISKNELFKYPALKWGNNGVGNRWCKKQFNYAVIYRNKKYKIYSENLEDDICENEINEFLLNTPILNNGIVGIKIFSIKKHKISHRPINFSIKNKIYELSCVVCGCNTDIIVDHKNDFYDDPLVLDIKSQKLEDFQPLCSHCNLQKRQICKKEKETGELFSAINIPHLSVFGVEFIDGNKEKKNSFWYDPVAFCKYIKHIHVCDTIIY